MSQLDPTVVLLALIIGVLTVAGLVVGFLYSVPFAVRRLRTFPQRGSSRRLFAWQQLSIVLLGIVDLVAFLLVAVLTLTMEPGTVVLQAIVRALITISVVQAVFLVIGVPLFQRLIEYSFEEELRRGDTHESDTTT